MRHRLVWCGLVPCLVFNAVDATYRSDLREINELNFSRFDARLDQRLAEYDAKWEQRLGQMKVDLIRWMFALWTGQLLALAGFLLAIVKLK
jgi:hypothetical protein